MPANEAGEMVRLVRHFDWAMTPLGPMADWPRALSVLVDLMLAHPLPAVIAWGPDLIQVYNDAYARFAGAEHPAALGRPARDCWPAAWQINAPNYERVFTGGESILLKDRVIPFVRPDARGDASLTQAYSPVRDDEGRTAGVFLTIIESTGGVVGEDALEAREEQFRLILENATDHAILTLDSNQRITSWSPGAEAVIGWVEAEVLGRPGDIIFTPEDRAAGAPEDEFRTAIRDGRAKDERWHLRKDGSRFFGSGVLTPLRIGDRLGYVKVLRDLTERKRMEDELRNARDELEKKVQERTVELSAALRSLEAVMARRAELARRLTTAQEDERRRVSRELHDSAGQLLVGLGLAFKAAESGDLPPATAAKIAEARHIVEALTREVHGLAVRLRPTSLDDVGLEPALRQLVVEWSARTGTRGAFRATGLGSGRLTQEVETAIYRVVQEALTNVAKHARASAVSVTVVRLDGSISVAIEDDGVGFEPEAAPRGRLGLAGMRERVALVEGEMEIESAPGSGATVFLRLPIAGGAWE